MYVNNGVPVPAFQHQPDGLIAQAAPVQNTWYTVLAANTNVRIYRISFQVATANETLEVEILIDGIAQVATIAAVAGTSYEINLETTLLAANTLTAVAVNSNSPFRAFLIEGRSVRVRIRKTTATGAGTIYAQCIWGKQLVG